LVAEVFVVAVVVAAMAGLAALVDEVVVVAGVFGPAVEVYLVLPYNAPRLTIRKLLLPYY